MTTNKAITPSNGINVYIANANAGLVNCKTICNKCDQVSDIVSRSCGWLGNVSDQNIIDDMTPEAYLFHHAARTHNTDWM